MEITRRGLHLGHNGAAGGGVGRGDQHEFQIAVLLKEGIALKNGIVDDTAAGLVTVLGLGLHLLGVAELIDVENTEVITAPIHLGAQLVERAVHGIGRGLGVDVGVLGAGVLIAGIAASGEHGGDHQQSKDHAQKSDRLVHDLFLL